MTLLTNEGKFVNRILIRNNSVSDLQNQLEKSGDSEAIETVYALKSSCIKKIISAYASWHKESWCFLLEISYQDLKKLSVMDYLIRFCNFDKYIVCWKKTSCEL